MNLTLTRFLTLNGATIGRLTGLSRTLYVLEHQWNANKVGVSCIPVGAYKCVPHGWEPASKVTKPKTWEVENVPGRKDILLHIGNYLANTQGCLLVGLGFSVTDRLSMVTSSAFAIELMRQEIGPAPFTITVRDA
ncbi:DUF5675 family protein [Mesorhizobium sp. ES1-1]|uniref:DUF5675 family protein n=1 Tax=Mesorhizobium sp. ES1-1 TaxID=2876629 RepID=UPI001CCDF0C1|nr:DUF5675 family protein [Mesorhizobium sp. ES1-1]MBZ9674562.1 DUF5675 family protein [Mesorhizobium sp. ES1-1]